MSDFKLGDKVIINPTSFFHHQQEYEDGIPTPVNIISIIVEGWEYQCDNGNYYDANDLILSESSNSNYEIY
jgi:hypothetical protein